MKEQRRSGDGIGYKVAFGLAVGIISTLFTLVTVMALGNKSATDARMDKQDLTIKENQITTTAVQTAQGAIVTELKNFSKTLDETKEAFKELSKELRAIKVVQ
jgi:Tfp pilus assembly protein PilO